MKYPLSNKYDETFVKENIMGPNPLKLTEELLSLSCPPSGSTVLDIGCGRGITSIFMVKEYGLRVFATDLWVPATENKERFDAMGLTSEQIIPIHSDANELPYANEFFDAIISIDSYNYFGRDPKYLGDKLLPFIKHNGLISIAMPGMKKDIHDNIPPELLLSWTPEQLDYLHDVDYWNNIISQTPGIEIVSIEEMESFDECWDDWLACDNEYAVGDRKSMDAGAGKYLNFISVLIRKK